jgi:hypothetical protein
MGIDVFLEWEGQDEERAKNKDDKPSWCSTTEGHVGYLREAYHGGPYATKMLAREAFESETYRAEIPAAVLRERLTNITEPARGCDGGHNIAALLLSAMTQAGANVSGQSIKSGATEPMTVEEAVRVRQKTLYDADDEHIEDVVQSFRDFVALAERKEAEHGRPCTVYASY